ncbi:glycosyltransferase family 2 protein [Rubellicoccus peritrichatus]|uniref:Glycosyltransferase family 2 protein n=1 Tax=Rubellicoccus peritrichatus TaxID=3080537 RepID=A0AAQ3QSU4_9BACT|nr:glycosyltransferase family 2 protein [Puniceicoccus sp. CR14]WOO42953.1 glycosyltransferase family 2 protein [Puniceicoccus sp. CR14]
MKLSLIIPVLNERDNLPNLLDVIDATFKQEPGISLELIFVDDGSTDQTFHFLQEQSLKDPRIKVIRFARNFGSHAALLAGFSNCTGDAAAYLAADLQDPPETVLKMVEEWKQGHYIVWGTREQRDDGILAGVFSKIYSSLMRKFALPNMPTTGLDLCLIDRKVIDAITGIAEKNTSIFGLILWTGFPQTFVPYHRHERKRGRSRWTLGKKIKLFVDSFVAFSFFPIRLVTYFGFLFSTLGFLYGGFVAVRAAMGLTGISGWASIITLIVFLSGIQLLMLGIVAEYLWRTFDESRHRPPYIIIDDANVSKPKTDTNQ